MTYHIGDCLDVMRTLPDDSVDLIVTSPPYAERRKAQYGGIPTAEYIDWFLPRSAEMMRLLKHTGSFVLNIKEHVEDGERSDYVMRLVLDLRAQGWRLVDQYIWHKTQCMPGDFGTRLKDAWENLFHFSLTSSIQFYPDAVRIPATWQVPRQGHWHSASDTDGSADYGRIRRSMDTHGHTARPSNVLSVPAAQFSRVDNGAKQPHPAPQPEKISAFFIGLLTVEDDTVLDPFAGSGTTCIVAQRMNRVPIGIELNAEYVCPLGQSPML